jgi:hypothetical protein
LSIIPLEWSPIIQLVEFIGALIVILTVAVKITRHITKVEGRINLLEERINSVKADLQRQDAAISGLNNYLLNLAASLLGLKESKSGGKDV